MWEPVFILGVHICGVELRGRRACSREGVLPSAACLFVWFNPLGLLPIFYSFASSLLVDVPSFGICVPSVVIVGAEVFVLGEDGVADPIEALFLKTLKEFSLVVIKNSPGVGGSVCASVQKNSGGIEVRSGSDEEPRGKGVVLVEYEGGVSSEVSEGMSELLCSMDAETVDKFHLIFVLVHLVPEVENREEQGMASVLQFLPKVCLLFWDLAKFDEALVAEPRGKKSVSLFWVFGSVWKSSLKTGKRPELDRTRTDRTRNLQDCKRPGLQSGLRSFAISKIPGPHEDRSKPV